MSNSLHNRLTLLGIALLLTACAADRPAPVESRTSPPPAVARPAPAPAPASAALPPKSADVAGVQARPVPSAGVQVRPLPGSADARAVPPAGAIRSQPQGLKKPYSEAALAELRGQGVTKPASSGADTPGDSKAEAPKSDTPKADASKADAAKADTTKPEAREQRGAGASDFAWPAKGRLIQGFAEPRNMGIAIAGTPGDPVQAAADGKVIFSGAGPRGYGNLLIIKHEGDTLTVYAHNRALLVKDGALVKRGQQIAELGDSGTDRPKLHFEIRKAGRPVDPITVLPSR